MKMLFALLAVAACAMAAAPRWHALDGYTFEQYQVDHGKTYASAAEHTQRKAIFEQKLADIKAHNLLNKTWKNGVNKFTDRTDEEFKSLLGYAKSIGFARRESFEAQRPRAAVAGPLKQSPITPVDWRTAGIVTPVKDQGDCGSCWSFATAETLESAAAKKTGHLSTLSEQQILSCVPNPDQCGGTGGCEGGTAELAYATLNGTGLSSEWTYPYTSYFGTDSACEQSRVVKAADIVGYERVESNNFDALQTALTTVGPIAISVEAIHWSAYESGVFDGCNQTEPDIDHAVVLVGQGHDATLNVDYWLVRNSWSPTWGENGYIRVLLTANEATRCGTDVSPSDGSGCKGGPPSVTACGTCAILYDNCYPLV